MMDFLAQSLSMTEPDVPAGDNDTLSWQWISDGVMMLTPKQPVSRNVVISAGVHGNETAPVEILNQLVTAFLNEELSLGTRVLVVLGNIRALADGQRFEQVDLNRLFSGLFREHEPSYETRRADELEHIIQDFFQTADDSDERWHFDLHTAIRRSYHLRFALLPQMVSGECGLDFMRSVQAMGLDAIVLNPTVGGTLSYFTSQQCDCLSCTLELGKAKPFGTNELSHFMAARQALQWVMEGKTPAVPVTSAGLHVYRVSRELTKYSDDFHFLGMGNAAKNFTRFAKGTLIARDSEVVYQVEHPHEWLIFPNPHVHQGLRAGILLEKVTLNEVQEI